MGGWRWAETGGCSEGTNVDGSNDAEIKPVLSCVGAPKYELEVCCIEDAAPNNVPAVWYTFGLRPLLLVDRNGFACEIKVCNFIQFHEMYINSTLLCYLTAQKKKINRMVLTVLEFSKEGGPDWFIIGGGAVACGGKDIGPDCGWDVASLTNESKGYWFIILTGEFWPNPELKRFADEAGGGSKIMYQSLGLTHLKNKKPWYYVQYKQTEGV